jgi:hypothetical protein
MERKPVVTHKGIEILNHLQNYWKYIPRESQLLIITKTENGVPTKKSQKICYNGIIDGPEMMTEKAIYVFQSTDCLIVVDIKKELKDNAT